jgi:hypothetical protein
VSGETGAVAVAAWRSGLARGAVVVAVALVVLSLDKLWSYANTDNPKVVEQSRVVGVANAACAQMREAAAAAAVGTAAPIGQRVGALNAQNDAVTQMVSVIRRLVPADQLSGDQPVEQWLDDWGTLVQERDAYARSLATGNPTPLVMPVVGGRSLADRLNNVGLNCRVPTVLLAP